MSGGVQTRVISREGTLATRPNEAAGRTIRFAGLPGRRQDEQKTTVIIVGGKEIGNRFCGQISFRVDGDGLSEPTHPPL